MFLNKVEDGAIFQIRIAPEKLLGKSPEYIQAYAQAYERETLRLRTTYTALGAFLPSAIVATPILYELTSN